MKQFLIVLPNTDAESHSCRNFEIPDLGPGRVIRGDRRIHDDSVQASKGQIDELLNLPVVASNRNVSEALDITFRERYPQYTGCEAAQVIGPMNSCVIRRSEEHTSELQSRLHLVCRLLLEKKKIR